MKNIIKSPKGEVWGVLCRFGDSRHLAWEAFQPTKFPTIGMESEKNIPALFPTRKMAREWIELRFGYIAYRSDLQAKPFNWRMPKAVKVKVVQIHP